MSSRLSLGLVVAAALCCAGPVLVGPGLAAAVLGVVHRHWGWFAAGSALVAAAVFVRVQRTRAA